MRVPITAREQLPDEATLAVCSCVKMRRADHSLRAGRQVAVEMLQTNSCSQHSRMHMGHLCLRICANSVQV